MCDWAQLWVRRSEDCDGLSDAELIGLTTFDDKFEAGGMVLGSEEGDVAAACFLEDIVLGGDQVGELGDSQHAVVSKQDGGGVVADHFFMYDETRSKSLHDEAEPEHAEGFTFGCLGAQLFLDGPMEPCATDVNAVGDRKKKNGRRKPWVLEGDG